MFRRPCQGRAAFVLQRKGGNSEWQLCVNLLELGVYSETETLLFFLTIIIIITCILLLHFF